MYGKQVDDKVLSLTTDDIETCKKRDWKYKLPENLRSENENEEVNSDEEEEDDEEKQDEDDEEKQDEEDDE